MSSDYNTPDGLPPRPEPIEPAQPYVRRSHPTSRKLRPGMTRKEAVRGYYAIAQELAAAEAQIAELEAQKERAYEKLRREYERRVIAETELDMLRAEMEARE